MTEELSVWFERALLRLREEIAGGGASVTLHARDRDNAAFVLDADGENTIGQFIVWPTGAIESTVLSVTSGEQVHHVALPDGGDRDEQFGAFLDAVREVEHGGR